MAKKTPRQVAAQQRYRALYKAAKAKGLVSKKVPLKSFKPSKYMKTKLNALEPYLGKDYTAVKVDRNIRKAWKDAPSAQVPKIVNGRALVRTPPGGKVKASKGTITIVTHLKAGTFEQIPLPVKVANLAEFREWFENNTYYDNVLKHRDERFNFRIFGNDSYNGFGNLDALFQELERYDNFEPNDWQTSEEFWRNFELFRSYKDWTAKSHMEAKAKSSAQRRKEAYRDRRAKMSAERRAEIEARERENRRARRESWPGYDRELEARRKKRANETPEEKEARRAANRARMAAKRKAAKDAKQ